MKNDDTTAMKVDDPWGEPRRRMVDEQLRRRGIRDSRVLSAMMSVPREVFVPPELRGKAYEDRALPIGHGQTISQPYIVAYMTEMLALTPTSRVLEIGTGTGYQTAILASLAASVFTVERLEMLQKPAAAILEGLGYTNVAMRIGDGSIGLPSAAPFDRILVTAAAPKVPIPLVDQLCEHGLMVIPVGGALEQTVVRVVTEESRTVETRMLACRFVKLHGQEGWAIDDEGGSTT